MNAKNIIAALLSLTLLVACDGGSSSSHSHNEHDHQSEVIEQVKGPHGGKLFEKDGFALEVTIYEPEIPPQSRVYTYLNGKPLDPSEVKLTTELHRINRTDTINYKTQDDYLLGDIIVEEPHSFDVKLKATYKGNNYSWDYSSYEGRTTLSPEAIQSTGIEIEKAAGTLIRSLVNLNGRVLPNRQTVANISARFPGVIKSIRKLPGSFVEKGEVLATIESNESLKVYDLTAPLAGEVLSLNAGVGEAVGDQQAIFLVGDLSTVWIELLVPKSEFSKLKLGQKVLVTSKTEESEQVEEGKLIYLSPLADPDSQTLLVRVEIPNPAKLLVPELFVEAQIVVEERNVPVAVRKEALQTFRDWEVVFLKVNQNFEIAILELGQEDGDWVEVKQGLNPGDEYVTKNSFVVKADVMKSGATHDH